jgi:hypothetical protein
MHLEVLYRVLHRYIPEKRSDHEKLRKAASFLAQDRRSRIPDEKSHAFAKVFAESLGGRSNRLLLDTGLLVVAAVADEKAGVKYAVTRLESWIADPLRFDELKTISLSGYRKDIGAMASFRRRWPEEVQDLIEKARAH